MCHVCIFYQDFDAMQMNLFNMKFNPYYAMKNDKSRWTQYFRVFVDFFNYWIANFLHNELVNIDWFSFHLFAVLRQRASVSSQRQKTLAHSISFHINYDCECWRSGGGGNGAGIFRGFLRLPPPPRVITPPTRVPFSITDTPPREQYPPTLINFWRLVLNIFVALYWM